VAVTPDGRIIVVEWLIGGRVNLLTPMPIESQ
jgi:hypothetical protein